GLQRRGDDLLGRQLRTQLCFLRELGLAQLLAEERDRLVVFIGSPARRAADLLEERLAAREQPGRRTRLTEGCQGAREAARVDRDPPAVPQVHIQAEGFRQQWNGLRRPTFADRKSRQRAQRQRLQV